MTQENVQSARGYRQAAQAYLGVPKVEAAGIFEGPSSWWTATNLEEVISLVTWLYGRVSPFGRLRGSFLLAVTNDQVHAVKYTVEDRDLQILEEIGAFDRKPGLAAELRRRGSDLFRKPTAPD